MGKRHRLEARRQTILAVLHEAGELSVAELSRRCDVSEVTIRSDLRALNRQGLLLRVRGGAVATNALPDLSFEMRQQQRADRKARIGMAAASLVRHGDTIAIDASTTAISILPYLRHLSDVTVVTNGLKAAMMLLGQGNVHVIVTGGSLRRESISLVGQAGCSVLQEIHINVGFLGARGFTLAEGLTDVNLDEVRTKRVMAERCRRVVAVVDGSKWGQVAATTIAHVGQIDTVITDLEAPVAMVAALQDAGIQVIQV